MTCAYITLFEIKVCLIAIKKFFKSERISVSWKYAVDFRFMGDTVIFFEMARIDL